MKVLLYLGMAILLFGLAIRIYGRYLAKVMGEDNNNPTPANTNNDGRDFVPTGTNVLFAHHFSAIAGAGPILGPTVAVLYGFLPAWLWVVFGGIFIGAVHDFMALFICMREGGRSVSEVAKKTFGKAGFVLFILFTLVMLVLVTSAFLSAVSMSLTSSWPLAKLGMTEGQTLLRTTVVNGETMARIGGVASTSVVIITLCSPFLGWLLYKKRLKSAIAYPLAAAICIGSVILGFVQPITLGANHWTIIISIYVLFASGVPVWIILQPRDFINVQILYAGIALMAVALAVAGAMNVPFTMPDVNLSEGTARLGMVWPMMFILIACGAISGFHSLVAGGTTGKQLNTESDARRIGFNAMLLESLLAVCVLLALGVGLGFDDYKAIVYPVLEGAKSNPILAFSLSVGRLVNMTLGIRIDLGTVFGILLVEGFVITTLDAAVRLNRYLFEELWEMMFANPPALLRNHWFNSLISVILMWVLAYTNAFNTLWPIFGAANQLLAALGLITVTGWLLLKGRKFFFALAPALFMLTTTTGALIILFFKYMKEHNLTLAVTAVVMLGLSAGVVWLVLRRVVMPYMARQRG